MDHHTNLDPQRKDKGLARDFFRTRLVYRLFNSSFPPQVDLGAGATQFSFKTGGSIVRRVPTNTSGNIKYKDGGATDVLQTIDFNLVSPFSIPLLSPSPGICSPYPLISFSPLMSSDKMQMLKMHNTLQELLETEQSFVTLLQLFNRSYTVSSFFTGSKSPVPIRAMVAIFSELETHHSDLLKTLYAEMKTHTSAVESLPGILEILRKAISVRLYTDYSQNYELVVQLVNENSRTSASWLKGWEKFLEATQPKTQNLDLSFFSLLQKPIGRVTKYKLIVESLAKCSNIHPHTDLVQQCYTEIVSRLSVINDNTASYSQVIGPIKELNSLVTMKGIACSISFFGPLLTCGGMKVVWVNNDQIKSMYCGALMFKSHLILVDFTTHRSDGHEKPSPLFVIPLSKSVLTSIDEDFDGGLFTTFPFALKLTFEYRGCLFETLFLLFDGTEYSTWKNELTLLCDYVNTPTDTGWDDESPVCKFPRGMNPVDVRNLHGSMKNECYFKRTKSISVIKEECSFCQAFLDDDNVRLKLTDRLSLQNVLQPFWSKEIPIYSKCQKHRYLDGGSLSWYSQKMKLFRGNR